MIARYNPLHAPDPDEWLALGESQRIGLVVEYHNRTEEDMPNACLHSTIHAVIEYQIACGDEYPGKKAQYRLVQEGLDRYIH